MDTNKKLVKKLGRKYDVPAFTCEKELLKIDDIDAVYIATPTYLHCKQVLMAAEAKKHVLCEKPIALNLEQAKKMHHT